MWTNFCGSSPWANGYIPKVHDDVIKWKLFPRYWPFVREIHRSTVNSPKASDAELCQGVFFDLHLNKRLKKPSRRREFETPSRLLWRHCNVIIYSKIYILYKRRSVFNFSCSRSAVLSFTIDSRWLEYFSICNITEMWINIYSIFSQFNVILKLPWRYNEINKVRELWWWWW